jgi:MATE family multidrug resistance protein
MHPSNQDVWPTRESGRELWQIAWPFILSNSCWTLQIVLDRVLLSQSSTEAVGAGISAVMMFWSILALFQWTTTYASTFVAQYIGAGQPLRVGAVIGQAMWFSVFAGVGFLILVPFADTIVAWSGHDSHLLQMEATYLRYLCFAALPFLINATASSFFGGRGQSLIVLVINASGVVVNVCVAWVLIKGKFGFPAMGVAGAGWATVAGGGTSAVIGLLLLLRPRYIQEFGNLRCWGFDRELFGRLMYYGLPQGIGTCLETLAFSAFLIVVGRLGIADLAATSIACTLNLLAFLPMMGVGQAIEVLVGQHLGANKPTAAARAAWTGLIFAFGMTLGVALAYIVVPHWLAMPFQTENDAVGWAAVIERVPLLLRFVALYCVFDCLNVVFAFALRGAGDTRFVTAVAILISWPIMVVPTYLAWKYGWGLYWAWTFASLYVILLALIYFARFLHGKWKTMRVIEKEAQRQNDEDERMKDEKETVDGFILHPS